MSGSGSSNQQDVDIDLSQLMRAIWQRKGRILVVTAVAAGLAFAGASMISPSYKSETRILIEARAASYAAEQTRLTGSEPVLDELNIVSQVQLLRSVDLIKQVARDLKLYDLEEFDPDTNPSALSDIMVLLGLKKSPLDLAPEERVLKAFQEKLQVYQVEKSRVIGIEFTSKDPKLAAAIPNAMVKVYLSLQSGAKLDSNSEAARWLEPEIANLREKVREAEQKIADYRSSSDLLRTSETSTFANQQLNDISVELARVRGERANAEAKAENVKAALEAGKPTDTLDAVISSQAIQQLKQSESAIRSQISDLSTSLLDGHPRLKALRSQLSGIREQIAGETRKIVASLESEANVSRIRERQLVQQLNAVKADSARAGEDEVGLKALEREAVAQRQLLETYLARYREASTRLDKGSSPADARIISQASEPSEPSFPKVLPITIVAAVAAFILCAVAIMLAELFSGRALRPVNASAIGNPVDDEPEYAVTTPVADAHVQKPLAPRPATGALPASLLTAAADPAPMPDMDTTADVQETNAPHDEFSVASVASYLAEANVAIAISISPSGDDGSTATVMLAREIAESGRTVVLIDMTGSACPTRLMAAHRDLPGITDLLCGEAAFSDTIHPDRLSDAHVIPQGNCDIRAAMRGVDRLSMIADALSDAYDLVLIECGPANAESVSRLSRNGAHEIILSAPNPDKAQLAEIMATFESVGYADLVLMSERPPEPRAARKGRSAA
ncbi:chain-length determining protein [Agrobacterium sp. a22-2]|uniref:GumC family protein n=1 Tax=Agrobacterium sp. a22-2 TaxID=2283840 RepID=UPI00144860D1|nr:exopolysaccharide transport family protein [Agrobacterium sp. a22-2]NKN38104.1 chain-length determining protein [Agrobacterium sp. a22-2]